MRKTLIVFAFIIFLGCAIIMLSAFVSVFILFLGWDSDPAVINEPVKAARLARITIPDSATNLECRHVYGGMDDLIYGRFDIPVADLDKLLANVPANEKVQDDDDFSVWSRQMNEAWWQPKQLRNRKSVSWNQSGFGVSLLFGESDQVNTLTVYFFNGET
jgi:hypothetical protein